MLTRDRDIRIALHQKLKKDLIKNSDTIVIDELGLCQGNVRIDIAVIGNKMNGFEIKSEKDKLDRLGIQLQAYNAIFDYMTVVSGPNHIEELQAIIPNWWGIWEARFHDHRVIINEKRPEQINPKKDAYHIASLLWKDEAIALLEQHHLLKGYKSKPRYQLWERLAQHLDTEILSQSVREAIKKRGDWRVVRRQTLNGDSSRHGAKSQRSRVKLSRSRSPIYIGHHN